MIALHTYSPHQVALNAGLKNLTCVLGGKYGSRGADAAEKGVLRKSSGLQKRAVLKDRKSSILSRDLLVTTGNLHKQKWQSMRSWKGVSETNDKYTASRKNFLVRISSTTNEFSIGGNDFHFWTNSKISDLCDKCLIWARNWLTFEFTTETLVDFIQEFCFVTLQVYVTSKPSGALLTTVVTTESCVYRVLLQVHKAVTTHLVFGHQYRNYHKATFVMYLARRNCVGSLFHQALQGLLARGWTRYDADHGTERGFLTSGGNDIQIGEQRPQQYRQVVHRYPYKKTNN